MLIWDSPEAVNQFIGQHGGGYCAPGSFQALGWIKEGRLTGGLTFHNATARNIFVNIALSERAMPRGLLVAGLFYGFVQLKLRRLTFSVEESNLLSHNFVRHLGATLEATLREAGNSGDLHVYSLFPENCQLWSTIQNGKKQSSGATGAGPD